jgi:hypothetical protein
MHHFNAEVGAFPVLKKASVASKTNTQASIGKEENSHLRA